MKTTVAFILILLIAGVLRLYQLGVFPNGLTWDEAAIGYNAFGIATVHRDEWLHRMPIVFRSFGDYKSPLLIYATSVIFLLFSPTAFLIRLPVALSGIGLVVVSFFLTRTLLRRFGGITEYKKLQFLSLTSMLFVAVSPWAIHFSRIGFESMLAAFLVALGCLAWLYAKTKPYYWIVGSLSFALSLYAYHSAKVVVPLFVVVLIAVLFKDILNSIRWFLMSGVIAGCILLPLGYASFFGKANDRALSTTIVGKPDAMTGFLSHLKVQYSPSYLVFGNDITYRHSTKEVGVLYPIELGLMLIGVGSILLLKEYKKLWWVPTLFAISVLPAAIGLDVPHANRAILGLPWAQILAVIGCSSLLSQFKHPVTSLRKISVPILIGTAIITISLLSCARYLQIYARTYSSSIALSEFGYGYKELMEFVRAKESTVDKVYFTNAYGQAYIYLLLFKQLDPISYRQGALANYSISSTPFVDAQGQKKVLVVGTPKDFPPGANIIKEITYPDGTAAFQVVQQ
ncbi:hypothetical protein KBD71_00075 [Candidatus Woesebacteria bacterium]|nr:hypothetical protein [Candidatus Woesebacteria bacterium]